MTQQIFSKRIHFFVSSLIAAILFIDASHAANNVAEASAEQPWSMICDESDVSRSFLLTRTQIIRGTDGRFSLHLWRKVDLVGVEPVSEVLAVGLRCAVSAEDQGVAYCYNNPLENNDWINSYVQISRERSHFVDHRGNSSYTDSYLIRANSPYIEATRESLFRDITGRFRIEYPVEKCRAS